MLYYTIRPEFCYIQFRSISNIVVDCCLSVMFIEFPKLNLLFTDTLSVHYCNREVRIAEWGSDSEGYIRTPGYPHFYVGDVCRWRLRVNPEQRVRVTLLDVSLRGKLRLMMLVGR